jgi:hypothetical protein
MESDTNAHTGSQDMDEIRLLRAVLAPPPPPHPQVTARARQRLAERIEGSSLPAQPEADRRANRDPAPRLAPRAPGRSRRLRWAAAISGVAAVGLAGTLAVTSLLSGAPVRGQGGHGGLITSERPLGTLTGQPAQAFLTTLATRVSKTKSATARYWCLRETSAQLDAIGPHGLELTPAGQGEKPSPVSDYRYSIFAQQVDDDCFGYTKTSSRNVGGYWQDLGARPATARDAAAWRRDGSPAWHAWYGNGQLIASQPGPRRHTAGKPGQPPWGSSTSLPADPVKLRKILLEGFPGPTDPGIQQEKGGLSYAQFRDENLFLQSSVLLLNALSPAVRAADYQVLASVPGVHMKSRVTDPSGRTGTALWLGRSSRPGQILIVDPATGLLLADEWLATTSHGVYAPGTLLAYDLWQTPVWTAHRP